MLVTSRCIVTLTARRCSVNHITTEVLSPARLTSDARGRKYFGTVAPNSKLAPETQDDNKRHTPSPRTNSPSSEPSTLRSLPVTNEPFAKNLFLGKFDTRMLIFPEVLKKEEVEELNTMFEPLLKFFSQVDSKTIDVTSKIPDEVLQQCKDFGLYGQQIPREFGGLGLNATQFSRLSEAIALDGSIGTTLAAHQSIGLKGIIILGTDAQKAKYLPRFATGEYTAAFALTEPGSGSDAASIQTRATLSADGKSYLLNGNKIWITNGGTADVFTVFARTKVASTSGDEQDKITAFIVERAFGGVTSGKPEDKLGIRGSNTCAIHFENTPVPVENVLGKVGGGFKVAVSILNSGRFSMGASCSGAVRHFMRMVVEHAIQRKQFGRSISEFGLIKDKFAHIALNVYAMESMSYMTAGILDSYLQPDAAVEAAMVKVFSSEATYSACNDVIQVFGGAGFMKDYPYERCLRDARITMIFEGTNEILRLFISLVCLQHAGIELRDTVKRLRNPLNNFTFMLRKGYERAQTNRKNPALKMKLYDHVHPSLSHCGEELETRVVRLQYMVEKYLGTYADKMVEQQQALKRFADISIDLFAITACISRASRSKSIGLRNNDHEVLLARTFTALAVQRIDRALLELDQGEAVNGDIYLAEIADAILKNGGYVAEHPLTRNW